MRTIRTTASRRIRPSFTHESNISPLQTTQKPPTCLICTTLQQPRAPQPPSSILPPSRRFQSHAATQPSREAPFATASPSRANPPQTHYEFFPTALPHGAPPTGPFAVDLTALKKEFLQLQARAHPDMHAQSEKKRAEALSSAINTAYKTLQSPLLRAQYVLSLQGIETAEDETAKVDDPELLMEVLEARELIDEAEREEDLMELRAQNEERMGQSIERLGHLFATGDWEEARGEVVKLRYWSNIRDSIEGWEKGVPIVLQH